MSRLIPRWVLALAALVPLAAQAQASPEQATMAVPAYSIGFSLGYLAEDLGVWERHGVRIASRDIAGIGAINAVIAGSVEFAQVSGSSLTRAAAHGQRLLAIAETVGRPISQVVLRKSLADAQGFSASAPLAQRALALKGRSFGVGGINSVQHAFLRVLARRAGFDPEAITVAPMAAGSMEAAFEAGRIDGFVESVPWPEQAVLTGKAVMIASGPDGDPPGMVPFANTVVVTRPETCERRKILCEGVARSFAEMSDFVAQHPADALAALQKRFPNFDGKLLAASFDVLRKVTPRRALVDEKGLENAEIFNVEAGLMKPEEKLGAYDGLFTNQFNR